MTEPKRRNRRTTRSRGTGARLQLVLAAAAICAVLVACSGDEGDIADSGPESTATSGTGATGPNGDEPSTTEPTATSAPAAAPAEPAPDESGSVEDEEGEIAARYVGYWNARFAANSPPDPDDPGLREFATGAQLDRAVAEAQANLDAGVEYRRADDPADFRRVDVVSVDGGAAVVQECVVNDGVVVRSETGEVVDDSVVTHNIRGDMRLVDGEWRLAATQQVQQWEGVTGCALAG